MELSKRALQVPGSVTLMINTKAKEMQARGISVVSYGAGEPDFDTPEYIRKAAQIAIDNGMTRYTPVAGTMSLRKAICAKLERENGVRYTPEEIVVSNGAKHALYNAFVTLLNPGDEVIIPAPYWVSYPEMVKMCGGVPIFVPTTEEDGFTLQPLALEAAITPRTRALILCNPCNPTGAYIGEEKLEEIAKLAIEHDFMIIADEIYEKLLYVNEPYTSIASLSEEARLHTILINGASKAFAMTGWRLGYSASEKRVAQVMTRIQSQATGNASSISQAAMETALTQKCPELPGMVAEFKARRELLCDGINAISGLSCRLPKGAFYQLVNLHKLIGKCWNGTVISDDMVFTQLLLEEAQVAVVPGVAFGAPNYIRLSYATSRDIILEGLMRIKEFVEGIK